MTAGDAVPQPTRRLRFRPYLDSDESLVRDLFADAEARRFYSSMSTSDSHRNWILWNQESYRDRGFGLWVIETIDDGEVVGDCGLTVQSLNGSEALEVGYHVLAGRRGQGYATEAAVACREHAFRQLEASWVCSIVDPRNTASIAVAERIHASRSSFMRSDGAEMLLFSTTDQDGAPAWP